MTFGKPTTLSAVLDAIEARIATCLSLQRDYVFTSLGLGPTDDQGGPADTFAVITGLGGQVEQAMVAGGGFDDLSTRAQLTMELWNRTDLDEAYRDTAALKDPNVGILAKWRKLLKRDSSGQASGLQLYAPVATTGATQSILAEPMRLLSWAFRGRTKQAGWIKVISTWEVIYLEDTTS